ncbi:MAG TPA: hydantoinase/oxoprolinase N-terminal domain-containing protein, partial [Thermomicrobiales bacterium]|nr:hydantoinase/oxoprolinase N-terminal domain-containing protein [Thermomicrobiales bacterium]
MTANGVQVGIDTGGTFTDLAAYDPARGAIVTSKTPSVPSEPGRALLDALDAAELPAAHVAGLVHGTT